MLKRCLSLTDGPGMARSDLCMQIQADVARIPIRRPQVLEATCLGAAIAAGLAIGIWKDLAELKDINTTGETIFEPKVNDSTSKKMITKFEKAIVSRVHRVSSD